jgi:hypothetical protein
MPEINARDFNDCSVPSYARLIAESLLHGIHRANHLRRHYLRPMARREIPLRYIRHLAARCDFHRRYSHRLADRDIHRRQIRRCNHRRLERCAEEEQSMSLLLAESRQAAAY